MLDQDEESLEEPPEEERRAKKKKKKDPELQGPQRGPKNKRRNKKQPGNRFVHKREESAYLEDARSRMERWMLTAVGHAETSGERRQRGRSPSKMCASPFAHPVGLRATISTITAMTTLRSMLPFSFWGWELWMQYQAGVFAQTARMEAEGLVHS